MALVNILIINPNTNQSMTDGLQPIVDSILTLHNRVHCDFFTAPLSNSLGAFSSINSPNDVNLSAEYCFPHIAKLIATDRYDGVLVACYSEHPLVSMIKRLQTTEKHLHVIGIFEASVMTSLGLGCFGIVTTGKIWEAALSNSVQRFLGLKSGISTKFAGVEATGLTAEELHCLESAAVCEKIQQAVERLVQNQRNIDAICMGCAGMVGFDAALRRGISGVLGEESAKKVRIVEGVSTGLHWLIAMCRLA